MQGRAHDFRGAGTQSQKSAVKIFQALTTQYIGSLKISKQSINRRLTT